MKFCVSVTYDGRAMQFSYRNPRELVRALRQMGKSSAKIVVRKIYTKGVSNDKF